MLRAGLARPHARLPRDGRARAAAGRRTPSPVLLAAGPPGRAGRAAGPPPAARTRPITPSSRASTCACGCCSSWNTSSFPFPVWPDRQVVRSPICLSGVDKPPRHEVASGAMALASDAQRSSASAASASAPPATSAFPRAGRAPEANSDQRQPGARRPPARGAEQPAGRLGLAARALARSLTPAVIPASHAGTVGSTTLRELLPSEGASWPRPRSRSWPITARAFGSTTCRAPSSRTATSPAWSSRASRASPPTRPSSRARSPRATRTTSRSARSSKAARASRRRSSSRSRAPTSATPATCCAASTTTATARTATSRSRSTPTSRTTRRPRSRRPSACTA